MFNQDFQQHTCFLKIWGTVSPTVPQTVKRLVCSWEPYLHALFLTFPVTNGSCTWRVGSKVKCLQPLILPAMFQSTASSFGNNQGVLEQAAVMGSRGRGGGRCQGLPSPANGNLTGGLGLQCPVAGDPRIYQEPAKWAVVGLSLAGMGVPAGT